MSILEFRNGLADDDAKREVLYMLRLYVPKFSAKFSHTRTNALVALRQQLSFQNPEVLASYDAVIHKFPDLDIVKCLLNTALNSGFKACDKASVEEIVEALLLLQGTLLLLSQTRKTLLDGNGIWILLEQLLSMHDEPVQMATLDVLAALVVDFPVAQMGFVHAGGFAKVAAILKNKENPTALRGRAVELVSLFLHNTAPQKSTDSTKMYIAARVALGGDVVLKTILETVILSDQGVLMASGESCISLLDAL